MQTLVASQVIPISLSLLAALLGAAAQFFFKSGSSELFEIPIYKNFNLLGGLLVFWCVLILILFSFRFGGKMSVVYPVYGSTYIWSLFIAKFLNKEAVGSYQLAGVIFILIGIGLVMKTE